MTHVGPYPAAQPPQAGRGAPAPGTARARARTPGLRVAGGAVTVLDPVTGGRPSRTAVTIVAAAAVTTVVAAALADPSRPDPAV